MVSRRHRKRVTLGPYLLLSTLGKGEFAKVKLGIHVESGQKVAIKLIKMDDMDCSRRIRIDREIKVLKAVNHPNIVKMYSVIETRKTMGIVLECATGGELFDYINSRRRLKETEARRLFAQLVDGVHHLHQRQIIHRDLKLENLLLDHHHNLLIIDFGFAHVGSQEQQHEMITSDEGQLPCSLLETACGSPCYAAPELVLTEESYKGPAADIWSCGVILYAMLCGYLPYQDDNLHQLYRTMVSQPPEFPDHMSTDARDLVQKMMMPDPEDRCSMATILAHPWLQQDTSNTTTTGSRLENSNTFSCPVLGGTFSYSNANPRPYSLTAPSHPRKAQSLQHNNEPHQSRKPLFMTWLLRKRRGGNDKMDITQRSTLSSYGGCLDKNSRQ
ncbi:kinase-like protein [Lichtheimia hyalospora FSU 10163]|nr:kinase-like protein [Lichtheimia hyalospora FSU 10163]